MTSVYRGLAQRNTNNTKLVPARYNNDLSIYDISGAAVYTVNITNAHNVGGMYYVDLDENDLSGNPLNFDGRMISLTNPSASIPIIIFAINIETNPAVYPGLEVPVFFRNVPIFATVGIMSMSSLAGETLPMPFIVSPPWPGKIVGKNISPNITFKSDGENFDVVSSGPAGWFGVPALATIITAFTSII